MLRSAAVEHGFAVLAVALRTAAASPVVVALQLLAEQSPLVGVTGVACNEAEEQYVAASDVQNRVLLPD